MMKPILITALAAGLLLPACAGAQSIPAPGEGEGEVRQMEGHAGMATLGDLTIEGASIGNAPTSAIYMTIATSGAPDRLIAAASPAAQAVELHTSLDQVGVMKMQRIETIPVAPDAPAELAPGGRHVMLIGLAAPLEEGMTVPLTLTFERAGEVTLDVAVAKNIAAR
jgi:copper(I)-binding protein